MATDIRSLPDLGRFIKERKVFWGEVVFTGQTADHVGFMRVRPDAHSGLGDALCVIHRPEADMDFRRGTLDYLLGQRVPFTVLGTEGEYLTGSRKAAQQKNKEGVLEEIQAGKEFTARILNLVDYGAFLEVNGVVGLLKNSDWSDDWSEVWECRRIGDRIRVRCKEVTSEGRIYWEAVNRYRRSEIPDWNFEENTAITGVVRSIRSFENGLGVFVRIGQGVDALCTLPENVDVEERARVALRITRVEPRKEPWLPPRVRGRILRVVS